ncbi:MAG TPA: signal peptidase I [Candidatus Paceibacterota bacterium]|jgi:signal peptidase I|nr:signal peptidase I [Candidatus Paceibacterota bacterium]
MDNERGPLNSQVQPAGKKESYLSLAIYTVIALGLALLIRFFVAAPYVVDGTSMLPTFQNWNYLIVDRISYDLGAPQRGDVVVLALPEDTARDLIKRVIGLPGDTVDISGSKPTVTISNKDYPNGFTLAEPYIDPANYGGPTDIKVTLGPDQYYVLGDNRGVSADSRTWGVLPRQDIVGRVLLRLYPFNELGIFPGEARYE